MSRKCILCGDDAYGLCDPWEWTTTMHSKCHHKLINEHRKDIENKENWST